MSDSVNLGDMFEERDGYVLTHKEFSNIYDLYKYLLECRNCENSDDVLEVLTVESGGAYDVEKAYAVSFEVIDYDTEDSSYLISAYTGSQEGLILFNSFKVNKEDFSTMEDIEEYCAKELKSFASYMQEEDSEYCERFF